jgi:CHASE3 domain sensor protein
MAPRLASRPSATIRMRLFAGVGLSVICVAALGRQVEHSTARLVTTTRSAAETSQVISTLERLLSGVEAAETGQRGYLLTGDDRYLQPYRRAMIAFPAALAKLRAELGPAGSTEAPRDAKVRLAVMETLIGAKLGELRQTIDLRRTGGLAAALAVVCTDVGRRDMEEIRRIVHRLSLEELGRHDRSARRR